MSTDADIVELIDRLDSHMGQQDIAVLLRDCRLARDALLRLRAERDAAAREMRERCADFCERFAEAKDYEAMHVDIDELIAFARAEEHAAKVLALEIRALPLLATEDVSNEGA